MWLDLDDIAAAKPDVVQDRLCDPFSGLVVQRVLLRQLGKVAFALPHRESEHVQEGFIVHRTQAHSSTGTPSAIVTGRIALNRVANSGLSIEPASVSDFSARSWPEKITSEPSSSSATVS